MMAVLIKLNNSDNLISKIRASIDKGEIVSWSCDVEGDFTHELNQWRYKAWMRPYDNDKNGCLVFGFIGNKKIITTKVLYAIYHGRFVEMLLAHFDTDINELEVTSMPDSKYDILTTEL